MKYGIIGTNWITEAFIEGAKTVSGMELNAVYSRNLETGNVFAKKFDVKNIFTDLEEMRNSDLIEAVYIASPNSLHYEQSKLFLQAGKHVICEKTITVSPEQLIELTELANSKNLIYMEAIMMMHLPQRKLVKEALSKIGTISIARLDFSQLSSRYQSFLDGNVPNIFNPKFAAGCVMDLGVYCVYPAIDFFGIPNDIFSYSGFMSTGADGFGSSIFCYPDKQVNISYTKIGQSYLGSEIIGDKGTILIKSISQLTGISIIFKDGHREEIIGDVPKHILMSGEARSFYNFVTDLKNHKEDYINCQETAINVSKAMNIIRKKANIIFEQ